MGRGPTSTGPPSTLSLGVSDMPIIHLIPDDVPAADRRQVLSQIRRDIHDLENVRTECVGSNVPSLKGFKWIRTRLRSLKAMESAWLSVQMDGAV